MLIVTVQEREEWRSRLSGSSEDNAMARLLHTVDVTEWGWRLDHDCHRLRLGSIIERHRCDSDCASWIEMGHDPTLCDCWKGEIRSLIIDIVGDDDIEAETKVPS